MSNADLYNMTPPAYVMSAAEGEVSLDAEAARPEKTPSALASHPPSQPASQADTYSVRGDNHSIHDSLQPQDSLHLRHPEPPYAESSSSATPIELPADAPPVYFQELEIDAKKVHVRTCSILRDRPAIWSIKRRNIALSPLAATVLLKEGLVRKKDLELISQSAGMKRDPTDPLSAVAFGMYDTLGDILLGLVEGPVEAGRQTAQMVKQRDERRDEKKPVKASQHSARATVPHAAKQVAIGTGKGFGRMVGASFKAPMVFTHGLARGFHNVPKLYGDEVREYENVTDLRSGLSVSAKSFGHGITDGIGGFFIQPIKGAQQEGAKGFAKGFGKGLGGIVCKPAAGVVGLLGYSFAGVHKEIAQLKPHKNDTDKVFMEIGETELAQTTDEERLNIVKTWCMVSMRNC
ncbi:hypothetical protein BDV96DRAFT_663272 [Lophiotrema nucula]|uniref:Glycosyltransferase family 1 protein n=1 Tax=Lophiotrema nucula TaxID=690887 RepID=A0A6A5ZRD1_9PLEO|nr:hypothetical protein BDV96DRAFT_663272 [Lophiotrema nucula]